MNLTTWITSQIGAREHYAIPRALHMRGLLREMHTDIWCRHGRNVLRRGPTMTRSIAERCHPNIPNSMVRSHSVEFALLQFREGRRVRRSNAHEYGGFDSFVTIGRRFAQGVARDIERRKITGNHIFFGYNTGCLETLQLLKKQGMPTIVDQIDPGRVEYEIVREEQERWPGWSSEKMEVPSAYLERLSQEWQLCDMVVVNSEWSRQALMRQGVGAEKIQIVPLAYEPKVAAVRRNSAPNRPLQVLWLGSVILRKGIPYLLEAARTLRAENVEFVIAGPLGISEQAVSEAPSNVRFAGRITRDRASELYANADVFVLPTLSDGFAITQIEAMSHGLPVIATPNCAQVVTESVDGFIVPIRDSNALAARIMSLANDRAMLRDFSAEAIRKSGQYSLMHLAESLIRCGNLLQHFTP